MMTLTAAPRVSPYIIVALVALVALIAVVLVLSVVAVLLAQTGMLHSFGAALQGPKLEAPIFGVSYGPC
jgi:hypothetical protein